MSHRLQRRNSTRTDWASPMCKKAYVDLDVRRGRRLT
jgi:hypothetical protein